MDTAFQTHAPVMARLYETRLWTRGGIFSTSGGVAYRVSRWTAVEAFCPRVRETGRKQQSIRIMCLLGITEIHCFASFQQFTQT